MNEAYIYIINGVFILHIIQMYISCRWHWQNSTTQNLHNYT